MPEHGSPAQRPVSGLPADAGNRALLLMAHGSRDPRSAAMIEQLTCRVAVARPGSPVAAAYLEHLGPRPVVVARSLLAGGARTVVVVPLLLTSAHHSRVDVPAALDEMRVTLPGARMVAGQVLGPDDRLLDALDEAWPDGLSGVDGVVLAAAGTRDGPALASMSDVARRYGERHGVPCLPGYAAGAGPDVSTAVRDLRCLGAQRIAVASYFLAPGRLHDRVSAEAYRSGALAVSTPFGATRSVAMLTLARYDGAGSRTPSSDRCDCCDTRVSAAGAGWLTFRGYLPVVVLPEVDPGSWCPRWIVPGKGRHAARGRTACRSIGCGYRRM